MEDLRDTPPNLVKVTRIRRGPSDQCPSESYTGFLVDEYGDNMDSPEIGTGVYVAGQDSKQPWIFASDPVYRVEVYETHWVVITDKGSRYEISHDRVLQ